MSHLQKLRDCEQVAAVCYRMRKGNIEFLLVRTRGRERWTFPKGGAEPGLTHAQAAALEAFEEAGVHGRMEEAAFARYACRKRGAARQPAPRQASPRKASPHKSSLGSAEKAVAVKAHLCQVFRLVKPKECNRNRTWFSIEDAKRRLREGRESDEGAELARVVDKAVARIRRLRTAEIATDRTQQDLQNEALKRVRFEAHSDVGGGIRRTSFVPDIRRLSETGGSLASSIDAERRELLQCEVLEFSPVHETNRNSGWFPGRKKPKALGTGTRTH